MNPLESWGHVAPLSNDERQYRENFIAAVETVLCGFDVRVDVDFKTHTITINGDNRECVRAWETLGAWLDEQGAMTDDG